MPAPSLLSAALKQEPWALSALIYGLDELLDDEGRPVSERRAPSLVKQGVVMELKGCPYHDERQGKPMNVSALAQITKHLDSVLSDIRAFAAALPGDAQTWQRVLIVVLDQLAGPAVHVLKCRDIVPPVPARTAVGHKLAAGYFGVVRELLARQAQGEQHEVSVASLLRFVKETRALIGESEVCAGPPHLLARVSEALLQGAASPLPSPALSSRSELATALAQQVGLSIAWELFDAASERHLLRELLHRQVLQPRTEIVRRELDRRLGELAEPTRPAQWPHAAAAVPLAVPGSAELADLLRSGGAPDPAFAMTSAKLSELLTLDEGALQLVDEARRAPVAGCLAGYFLTYRRVVAVLFTLEQRLRELLGYAPVAPMKLNGVVLPAPKSLRWAEMLLGHKLRCLPARAPELALSSPRRSPIVIIPGPAA